MIAMLLPLIGTIFDKIFPDKEKANAAKLKLLEMNQSGELKYLEAQTAILTAEINSESWLARNWRPITMMFFLGLIGSYWFGYTPKNINENIVMELFMLVKIGLGGYVVGRSGEKIAKVWKGKS